MIVDVCRYVQCTNIEIEQYDIQYVEGICKSMYILYSIIYIRNLTEISIRLVLLQLKVRSLVQ